jgi:hypothetical protein
VISDFKRRAEGVRVKHSVNRNSVKLYDKAYTPQGAPYRKCPGGTHSGPLERSAPAHLSIED